MKRGIGRIVLVIVVWGFVYALPAVPLEGLPNVGVRLPDWAYEVDMWPQTLAIPGAIAGAIFLVLLAVTGRLRDFDTRPAAWLIVQGVVSGLIASLVVRMVVRGESALTGLVIVAGAALLGALAAPVSAGLQRRLASRGGRGAEARP